MAVFSVQFMLGCYTRCQVSFDFQHILSEYSSQMHSCNCVQTGKIINVHCMSAPIVMLNIPVVNCWIIMAMCTVTAGCCHKSGHFVGILLWWCAASCSCRRLEVLDESRHCGRECHARHTKNYSNSLSSCCKWEILLILALSSSLQYYTQKKCKCLVHF